MRVNDKKITENMSAENVEILEKSQNFMEPPNKKEKHMEEKQKLIKKKERSLVGPKRWLKYLLDLLKGYKFMCNFPGKGFDTNKTVQ